MRTRVRKFSGARARLEGEDGSGERAHDFETQRGACLVGVYVFARAAMLLSMSGRYN